MSDPIDFYFEFASPYSYIAAMRLPAIVARGGGGISWQPIELGAVWAAQGILDAYRAVQGVKRSYIQADARRVAADLGIVLARPAVFPPDATLARLAVHGLAMAEPSVGGSLTLNLWRRYWGEGQSISTEEDLAAATPDGIDPARVVAAAKHPGARDRLDAANRRAIKLSCFGVPWIVVDGEAYFGQDRLEMIEKRLSVRSSTQNAANVSMPSC